MTSVGVWDRERANNCLGGRLRARASRNATCDVAHPAVPRRVANPLVSLRRRRRLDLLLLLLVFLLLLALLLPRLHVGLRALCPGLARRTWRCDLLAPALPWDEGPEPVLRPPAIAPVAFQHTQAKPTSERTRNPR
eukprot:3344126-Rhodomonas_salina.3